MNKQNSWILWNQDAILVDTHLGTPINYYDATIKKIHLKDKLNGKEIFVILLEYGGKEERLEFYPDENFEIFTHKIFESNGREYKLVKKDTKNLLLKNIFTESNSLYSNAFSIQAFINKKNVKEESLVKLYNLLDELNRTIGIKK